MPGNANYSTALLTSTLERFMSSQVADTILNAAPLFEWLNSKGSVKKRESGGIKLIEPLMYAKNTTIRSYRGYDRLDISPQEGISAAEFGWAQYSGAVSISGYEERINTSQAAQLRLLETKWKQLRLSFIDELNIDMYADGAGNDNKDLVGLALMVDSAGTYGNIARASNAWWAAQETAVGGALQIYGSTGIQRMMNDCGMGKGTMQPELLLTTQAVYEAYEAMMAPYMRYTIASEGNAVFQSDSLMFRKARMTWDHECTSGVMYFLNSQNITFVVDQERDFYVRPFQSPNDQDAKVALILFMAALIANNCRHLGKLTGIS